MLTAYRIFKTKHAANWFDGEGALLYGGRWNSPGTRILYASESLSLAALEMLVNLGSGELLLSYSFATVEFDNRLIAEVEKFRALPTNWHDSPPPNVLQQIGDDWVESQVSAVMRVPSAVVPTESNYLINVSHKDFSKVKLGKTVTFRFDPRLGKR